MFLHCAPSCSHTVKECQRHQSQACFCQATQVAGGEQEWVLRCRQRRWKNHIPASALEPEPVLGKLWAVPFWPGFGTQSSWDEVEQWQTDIMGCGSLCHFFPCKVRDYWEARERKGRNCFSVRQLGLRYWLLSTHFFSAFLSHIDFIGGTEVTGNAINLHFLPELLSLVIKSSKAEYILLCDEQGQGSPRYVCIAWFYKLNKDHLGTWVTFM